MTSPSPISLIYLKQQLKDKLSEHWQFIDKYGEDPPESRNWKWGANTLEGV